MQGNVRRKNFTATAAASAVRLLMFVLVGLVFAAVGEYWFSVLIRGDFANFIGSIVFNTLYLVIVFISNSLLFRIRTHPISVIVAYYLLFGFVGLMIEWSLIGNSPWGNPQASQIGMFAYWTCLVMMPRIFTDDRVSSTGLRRTIVTYSGAYAVLVTVAGHVVPPGTLRLVLLIWGFVIGYVAATAFYVRYVRLLMKNNGGVPNSVAG